MPQSVKFVHYALYPTLGRSPSATPSWAPPSSRFYAESELALVASVKDS